LKPKKKFLRQFQKRFFLRFHMSLILGATTATGLLSSKALLILGLDNLVIRYPVSVLIAYLCFFLFIKIWLWYIIDPEPSQKSNFLDAVDVTPNFDLSGGSVNTASATPSGGGTFGGGGASGSYDDMGAVIREPISVIKPDSGGSGSSSTGGIDIDVDGDGVLPLVILGVIIAAVFGAGVYLVYEAPVILSEAAFEFLLAAGLVKPVKRLDDPDWMESVLRTTWIPFAVVLAVTTCCAWLIHKHYPDAVRLMDLIN
jgi:hypothetical protein